jgi:hypothetical protein
VFVKGFFQHRRQAATPPEPFPVPAE